LAEMGVALDRCMRADHIVSRGERAVLQRTGASLRERGPARAPDVLGAGAAPPLGPLTPAVPAAGALVAPAAPAA